MISFFFSQYLYIILKSFGIFKGYQSYLLDSIKQQVFLIKGECKHSGKCCQSITISDAGTPITNVKNWREFVVKHVEYSRFKPTLFNGNIQSFNCSNLQQDFKCSDYQNRPQMCRDYPLSYFLVSGKTHSGCGYYPVINVRWHSSLIRSIRKELDLFFDNDL